MEFNTENLTIGLYCEQTEMVTDRQTAAQCGSGLLAVFATPELVALMEKTAIAALEPLLPQGYTTVGTRMDLQHVKASPIGARITCRSELRGKDGRKLTFYIEASDDQGVIGTATHERFIVNAERFMNKFDAYPFPGRSK